MDTPYDKSYLRFLKPTTPTICLGTAEDCYYGVRDGKGTQLPWGTRPSAELLANVNYVNLHPTAADAAGAVFPAFLRELPRLRALSVPHIFIPMLTRANLPGELTCLQLHYHEALGPMADWKKLRWPGDTLPELKWLRQFTGFGSATSAWRRLGLLPQHLPALEVLACDLDGDQAALELACGFKNVKHLEFGKVKDLDVFDHCPISLEVLLLTGPTKTFSFARLERLKNLRAFYLNSSRLEIDCAEFAKLPELVGLDILNCKNLKNVEALLECPKLTNLFLWSCGKLSDPLKERFKAHAEARGFERLKLF